jgi:hypothetical protein
MSPTEPTNAVAVSSPMPGIASKRCTVASDIGPIRLVAAQVRFHISDGQQGHAMPVALRHAAPMMRRPAGFHHDVTRRLVGQKAPELLSIEPSPFDQPPLPIGDPEFKYGH